jgi:hypothetical protein
MIYLLYDAGMNQNLNPYRVLLGTTTLVNVQNEHLKQLELQAVSPIRELELPEEEMSSHLSQTLLQAS